MREKKSIQLESLDDILTFGGKPSENGITVMPLNRMLPFPEHKFKLYTGERLADMVSSIQEHGILMPILLWHREHQYVILSGHNRTYAAELAGLKEVPVIVKENLTYEEALLIVTETNLRQRSFSDMAESEKAYCLAQHYQAIKSQGKRNDLLSEIEALVTCAQISSSESTKTSSQVETKLRTDKKLGIEYGLSRANVARYIRISSLTDDLLQLLDNGKIAFMAAYTLSFITDTSLQQHISQRVGLGDMTYPGGYKLDMKRAKKLRQDYEASTLNEAVIDLILSGGLDHEKTSKPKSVKVKPELFDKYFAGQKQKDIDDMIEKALTAYFGGHHEG